MLYAALIGCLSALLVSIPYWVAEKAPAVLDFSSLSVIGIGLLSVLIFKYSKVFFHRKTYDGLTEFFYSIYFPPPKNSFFRWFYHGLLSLALSCFFGFVGPEGPAIELAQATQYRLRTWSARWFEQNRRTGFAVGMAGALSAAFGAPLAAICFPIELEIGGKSLDILVSALSSFFMFKLIAGYFKLTILETSKTFSSLSFFDERLWVLVLILGAASGGIGSLLIRFSLYAKRSLTALVRKAIWSRGLVAALFIALVSLAYKSHLFFPQLLSQVIWLHFSPSQTLFLFVALSTLFVLMQSGFGIAGVFWPLYSLGGILGFTVGQMVFSGIVEIGVISGIVGGSAFLGAVLEAPLASAILSYELTQNAQILLPCLVAGWVGSRCRHLSKMTSFHNEGLRENGLFLQEGRLLTVLDSVRIEEVMSKEFTTVYEHQPIANIRSELSKAAVPFLPVVNAEGKYLGMITFDLLEEKGLAEVTSAEGSPLSTLMEAKDFLYLSQKTYPAVLGKDSVSKSLGLFKQSLCLPVLSEDGGVIGLLFNFQVRLAYEREGMKRASSFVESSEI